MSNYRITTADLLCGDAICYIYLQTSDGKHTSCMFCFIMLWNTISIGAECVFRSIQSSAVDRACETNEYMNVSGTGRRYCPLACIHDKSVWLPFFYDVRRSICMLLPKPCFLLKPRHTMCTKSSNINVLTGFPKVMKKLVIEPTSGVLSLKSYKNLSTMVAIWWWVK